jgi:hypothetical protein
MVHCRADLAVLDEEKPLSRVRERGSGCRHYCRSGGARHSPRCGALLMLSSTALPADASQPRPIVRCETTIAGMMTPTCVMLTLLTSITTISALYALGEGVHMDGTGSPLPFRV